MYSEKNNISCLLTIHDKEWLIERVVKGLIDNFSELINEFIIVFDGCKDNSEQIVRNCLIDLSNIKIIYLYANDVFETRANNIGLKHVTNPYVIMIQDDIIVTEKHFDKRMLQPFIVFDDVFAVTAQTTHNNYFDGNTFFHIDSINNPNRAEPHASRDIFYIREISNRGPLMYDVRDLQKLNFLDENFAPYSYDDHDISYRARKELNKVSGLYWIGYISKPEWGTSRIKNQTISQQSHRKNEKIIIFKHKEFLLNKDKSAINKERILIYNE